VHRTAPEGHRVLITAPYGQDAQSVAKLFAQNGYDTLICQSIDELAAAFDDHVGAILVTEEALTGQLGTLRHALEGNRPGPTYLSSCSQGVRRDAGSPPRRLDGGCQTMPPTSSCWNAP